MKRLLVLSLLLVLAISLVGQTFDFERLPDMNLPHTATNTTAKLLWELVY